ncbi:hypothetical protein SEA_BEANWATER_219 [Mycobacterium phage BeanWater]|nr:hypothetical protein SEA_BEANWATER_219 [Mycobacterium phage BeanWater]
MTTPGKPAAHAYSAGSAPVTATSPLDFGDKCFLCSNTINIDTPPVEQRDFYISKNGGMFLCHKTCLNEMESAGGTPRDFHEARARKGNPVAPTPPPAEAPKPPVVEQRAGWLHFEKLSDLTAYTAQHGDIPTSTKVTVGTSLVQPGE